MPQRHSDSRLRLGTAALVAVNAALAGGLWLVANGSLPLSSASAPSHPVVLSAASLSQSDAIGTVPDVSELSATLSRPLFRADRRPALTASQAVAVVPPIRAQVPRALAAVFPKDLKLVGIVKTSAMASQRALLRSSEAPSGQLLGVGEAVAGWRIVAIGADDVVFETGAQRYTLSMFPKANN